LKLQFLAAPLALLLAVPAFAQNLPQPSRREPVRQEMGAVADEIKNLLAGDKYPLTLKLKDVDTGWRRMTIGAQLDNAPAARPPTPNSVTSGEDFGTKLMTTFAGQPDTYLTRGQTIKEGSESFLVTYRVRLDQQAIQEFVKSFPRTEQPPSLAQVTRLTEMFIQERPLDLALLNMRMVGKVADIRPFRYHDQMAIINTRLKSEFAVSEVRQISSRNSTSLQNLRMIGLGMQQYLGDNDDVLPPMIDPAAARKALLPYVKIAALFAYPNQPTQLYQPNPTLSGKKLAHLARFSSTTVSFYEANAAADGTRAVLFLDGTLRRIRETEWPQLKKGSRIP